MRKKQAARQRFTAAFALAALVFAIAVSDARANETLVDTATPIFSSSIPKGNKDAAQRLATKVCAN